MTVAEKEKWASEIFAGENVILTCADHGYGGQLKVPPSQGCEKCWTVFYTLLLANTPPHLRAEKLTMLQEMVAKCSELIAAGKWDFKPYDHPIITIERDVDDHNIQYIN